MGNILNAVYNNFEGFVINNSNAYINRAEFGFINTDCNFVKNMIAIMCLHASQNPDIFNEEQSNNVINIINKLSHE